MNEEEGAAEGVAVEAEAEVGVVGDLVTAPMPLNEPSLT